MKSEEVVTQTTATSTAMLSALRQSGNGQVWQQFCKRYRPLIVSFARSSFSLNEADAEDAAQDALAAFHVAYCRGDYDRDRGRLRKWLFGIAANHARALLRKKYSSRQVHSTDSAGLAGLAEVIPDDAVAEQRWEEEWRLAIYRECMVEVRRQFNSQTVEAFELFAKDGVPVQEVADRLGMTPNAIYVAKHHILKRIREVRRYLEESY